jgi:hypothetical protein
LYCLLAATVARADFVLYEERGKLKEIGVKLPDGVELTQQTAEAYANESEAFIVNEGYAGIEIKKRQRDTAGQVIPWSQVVSHRYRAENIPEALAEADDALATGNYSQALSGYRAVAGNSEVEKGFRHEARAATPPRSRRRSRNSQRDSRHD